MMIRGFGFRRQPVDERDGRGKVAERVLLADRFAIERPAVTDPSIAAPLPFSKVWPLTFTPV